MNDFIYIPDPQPFWFVTSELLSDAISAEIILVDHLLSDRPGLIQWIDNPEAEAEQRRICFAVAARNKVMFNMSDTIASRHEPSGPLDERETKTIRLISNLILPDAPAWVMEMDRVIERMPSHLYAALPQPLRTGSFDNSSEQSEAINALSTLEQLQKFVQATIDEQLGRLEARWRPSLPDHRFAEFEARLNAVVDTHIEKQLISTEARVQMTPSRRMNKRAGWEDREKLYVAIQKILKDNPTLQGIKFCAALDQRHAPPLHDWIKSGQWTKGLTWKEAWGNPKLCSKIRRVRQEAQKRA
ncbi:MAG: hypothetical protein WBQ07_20205 [Candidatus Acidiferrales bacterium]